jgi:hypothetical protein
VRSFRESLFISKIPRHIYRIGIPDEGPHDVREDIGHIIKGLKRATNEPFEFIMHFSPYIPRQKQRLALEHIKNVYEALKENKWIKVKSNLKPERRLVDMGHGIIHDLYVVFFRIWLKKRWFKH